MQDPTTEPQDTDLLDSLAALAGTDGYFKAVGASHHALFRPGNDTLLVEFDDLTNVAERRNHLPWSAGLARKRGWSTLTLLSDGRTWYRDKALFAYFDELTDDGFFDEFDKVVFFGHGVGAYGAAAYSVAAPGSTVVLLRPLATLDRSIVPWEGRFKSDWKRSFGPRYGYAPRMLDAAEKVFVISDPTAARDAVHASLFQGDHITHLPAAHGGTNLQDRLESMGILDRIVAGAEAGALTRLRFAQLWRARHSDAVWLSNMLRKVEGLRRPWLQAIFANEMLRRTGAPSARRRLNDALSALEAQGKTAPGGMRPTAPQDRDRMLLAGE